MNWKYYKPKFEYEDTIDLLETGWSGHVFFAYDLVRNTKPKRIVELGTHFGHSFFSFCQAAKDGKLDTELNAIDTWRGDDQSGFYGEEVFKEVKKIRDKYYPDLKINLLRKTFNEALSEFNDDSVDILHIDGLHTYEAVKHDFDLWFSKVKDSGVILLHDTFEKTNDFGVYELWEEIKKKHKIIEFYHSHGLGILFKKPDKFKKIFDFQEVWQHYYPLLIENRILGASLEECRTDKDGRLGKLIQEKDMTISDLSLSVQQKDQAIQQRDSEIQQKDQAIQQRDSEIQQKDQAIQQKDFERQKKDDIIQGKEREIQSMESSIFWKLRNQCIKIKSIFIKKQIPLKRSRNILFISHDASKSGAPFVLLYFLQWIKKNTDIEFSILLQDDGELEEEFGSVASTYVRNMNMQNSGYPRIVYYMLKYAGLRKMVSNKKLAKLIKKEKFDLIFANSVASSQSIIEIKKLSNIPTINYVHELESAIINCCGLETFNRASKLVDYYIGSSQSVIDNLKRNHNIPADKVELVYDYIPADDFFKNKDSYNDAELRNELNIPKNAFIVGASGTLEWRKGLDLYPQIACLVEKKSSVPIYFLWIGGDSNSIEYERIMQDLKKMKVKSKVFFVEYKIDYFSVIDVFLLPSREDPYPLVCLQAAAFQKPIICFESAGGMPEFVGQDCGFAVPYLDIEKAAEKIIYLAKNRDIAFELGKNASVKVLDQHDVEKVSKKLLKIMDRISK